VYTHKENQMSRSKRPKRLAIEISDSFHAEIKKRALLRNISIRKYVLRALIAQINNEKKYE
jgi:predicted HicB family RNase H-like nuclease